MKIDYLQHFELAILKNASGLQKHNRARTPEGKFCGYNSRQIVYLTDPMNFEAVLIDNLPLKGR